MERERKRNAKNEEEVGRYEKNEKKEEEKEEREEREERGTSFRKMLLYEISFRWHLFQHFNLCN